jgi:hypothetical protein
VGLLPENPTEEDDDRCYILFSSRAPGQHKLERLAEEIGQIAKEQLEMIDVTTREGEALRTQYSIQAADLPAILLIHNNTLSHHWVSPYLPPAREIAHYFRQASA